MPQKPFADGFSDDGVATKTGRTREEWYAVLDAYDAAAKGHAAAAKHLESLGIGPWWAQSIVIDYERVRLGRPVGLRNDGLYGFSVSRTMTANSAQTWAMAGALVGLKLLDPGAHWRAGDERGLVKTMAARHRLTMTCEEAHGAPSQVVIEVRVRPGDRATIQVTHRKLGSSERMDALKAFWRARLDSLSP